MRSQFLLLFLIVLTCGTALNAQENIISIPEPQQINWIKKPKEALALAGTSGKPILMDFTAVWCKPCQVMEKTFWVRPDIIKLSDNFVCAKIDFDNYKNFAYEYNVHGLPNVLITDPWGLLLFSSTLGFGSRTDEDILKRINLVPKGYPELVQTGALLEKDDTGAIKTFADFYQKAGFFYQSNTFYRRLLKEEKDPAKRMELMMTVGFNDLRINALDEALDVFEKFSKEFPASPQIEAVLYGQTEAYAKTGKTKNAQKSLDELKTRFPNSPLIAKGETVIKQPPPVKK
jgi:thiol-disulfide isomerase/thioredoxin